GEVVKAGAGMGIDDAESGRLVAQVHEDAHHDRMLDNVGKAAGVKGVAVIHGWRTDDGGQRRDDGREKIIGYRLKSPSVRCRLSSSHLTSAPRWPRTGGITICSRRQVRRPTSAQSRNRRSLPTQILTSRKRRLSQIT